MAAVASRVPPEARLAVLVERLWPRPPEWVQMTLAILKGEAFDADRGWWHPSASLHGWSWLRETFDADENGKIEPAELVGAAELLERLDRDEDGGIGESDLDPRTAEPIPRPAEALFGRLDSDGNDRVSWDELSWFFQQADRRKRGFITRRDLARLLPDLDAGGGFQPREREGGGGATPSKWRLLRMLAAGELGFWNEGPRLGEAAPDVRLTSLEHGPDVRLSSLLGKRPVVLVFGSFT